ncbi:hypothetical protein [Streptomyces celluloflavus]|uniref:hypothetical protein n=1 Tax=Streptomyces celluloflavus TaxID=58344 RepID=UPI0036B6800E
MAAEGVGGEVGEGVAVDGSVFTRYKTPAIVDPGYTPTFTPVPLRKDFDLGPPKARPGQAPAEAEAGPLVSLSWPVPRHTGARAAPCRRT